MGRRWSAKDFFIVAAIGLAGGIFDWVQYSDAQSIWDKNCSDDAALDQLSDQCKQLSSDMYWLQIELFSIIVLTFLAIGMGVMRLVRDSHSDRRRPKKGMSIPKIFIAVTIFTLIGFFVYAFIMRNI